MIKNTKEAGFLLLRSKRRAVQNSFGWSSFIVYVVTIYIIDYV